MKRASTFNINRIECPVCGTQNEFKGVKPKAYVETGRDTDFCPLGRDWRDSRHQVRNPLLYFMATCKRCFFTHELNKEFIEWNNCLEFNSPAFLVLKRKHLTELNQRKGAIKKMGKALRPSKNPFSSAVIKFLLGIYDENLKPDPSTYNLGRYYLRIAWLFREEKQKEEYTWIKENLTPQSFGQTLKSLPVQLGVAVTGFGFGAAEYFILKPEAIIAQFTWLEILPLVLIFLACTGFVEEFIFRGVLQHSAEEAFSRGGILYTSLVFMVLHLIHYSEVGLTMVLISVIRKVGAWSISWSMARTENTNRDSSCILRPGRKRK